MRDFARSNRYSHVAGRSSNAFEKCETASSCYQEKKKNSEKFKKFLFVFFFFFFCNYLNSSNFFDFFLNYLLFLGVVIRAHVRSIHKLSLVAKPIPILFSEKKISRVFFLSYFFPVVHCLLLAFHQKKNFSFPIPV